MYAQFFKELSSHLVTKFNFFISKIKFLSTSKHRYLFLLGLLLCGALLSFIASRSIIKALSLDFIQTDWSGGADTVTTINASNITGWTKYHSKTDGVNTSTAGEAKLNIAITQP